MIGIDLIGLGADDMLNLNDRRNEVRTRSDADIQAETAKTWFERAIACYAEYADTHEDRWLDDARSYADEALEHAGLVRDGGKIVGQYQAALDKAERDVVSGGRTRSRYRG